MLTRVIILAILVSFAFGRFAPKERQWNPEDARQNCTNRCEDHCICKIPKKCSEDETKCGEAPPENHPDCPPDEICVPTECACPTTPNCPLICSQECNDDELLCPGGTDPNGCYENDFCHPKGTGNEGQACPGFCPFECPENKLKCPSPDDPVTGCEVAPECIPTQTDNNGEECSHQECPVVCDDTEILCTGNIDHIGCKEGDTCVPKGTDDNGELCPGICPVQCGPDEILCKGQPDCNGCVENDQCVVKAKDINGDFCPDDSASHGCPINCCGDDIVCPQEQNSLGCLEKHECTTKSKDDMDEFCPEHSYCPTICQPNEVLCPVSEKDENGCDLPDVCITEERDIHGELCTVECPFECNENEVLCPGQRTQDGCKDISTCEPKAIKQWGSDKGGYCPGVCPPVCHHNEILCPTQYDPCDGCPTGPVCRPKEINVNGEFCPDESASHDCPKLCYENEVDGRFVNNEVLCPVFEDVTGCKPEAKCYQRTKDFDDEYCPGTAVCPVQCQSDEMECFDGIDERGCTRKSICVPRGTDEDGVLCERECPQPCGPGMKMCEGGKLANGCNAPGICFEVGTDCPSEEEVCEKKYNGYYSYGDCGEMDDVHSFEECCELTKEAQLLQPDRGITRFSYNGHKCYFKCGGTQDFRGGDFWSSTEDISTCVCGTHVPQVDIDYDSY